ncbi:hypothetical protein CDL15_Pgr000339 [Punica granatum]|uniref:Uncharacterized protein n=1 Tax=Punica granatum TaxID=22663 RepID=A0A218XUI6_PUNGR|nr:hypothetical protein CDL15_Pgr000339 [Punica granatum]
MNGPEFDDLTEKLEKLDPYIRASYHKFLELNQDVLAWTMAVDGLFLFDFLCRSGIDKDFLKSSEHLKFLADSSRRKQAEDAIMRDVMMLENQMPIFVLEKLLTLEYPGNGKIVKESFQQILKERECRVEIPDDIFIEENEDVQGMKNQNFNAKAKKGFFRISEIRTANSVAMSFLECVGNNPVTGQMMKPHVELIIGLMELPVSDMTSSLSAARAKPPVTSQNPTTTSLSKASIKFNTTDYIKSIHFDKGTAMFFLPIIKLGVNSEVINRNLIAYETMANMSSLMFARYIELMDGIIDTEDDVKLLVKNKIIVSVRTRISSRRGTRARAYAARLGSVHLPGDARRTHLRRSRHLPFYDPKIKGRQVTRV